MSLTPEQLQSEARRRLAAAKADEEAAEAKVADARRRVEKYETFLAVYEELGPTNGTKAKPAAVEESGTPERPVGPLSQPGLSILQAAEMVLREADRPLRNRQVAERMLAGGYAYEGGVDKLRNSVGSMMNRASEEGVVFHKVAAGLFGLREWQAGGGPAKPEGSSAEAEPPPEPPGEGERAHGQIRMYT